MFCVSGVPHLFWSWWRCGDLTFGDLRFDRNPIDCLARRRVGRFHDIHPSTAFFAGRCEKVTRAGSESRFARVVVVWARIAFAGHMSFLCWSDDRRLPFKQKLKIGDLGRTLHGTKAESGFTSTLSNRAFQRHVCCGGGQCFSSTRLMFLPLLRRRLRHCASVLQIVSRQREIRLETEGFFARGGCFVVLP